MFTGIAAYHGESEANFGTDSDMSASRDRADGRYVMDSLRHEKLKEPAHERY